MSNIPEIVTFKQKWSNKGQHSLYVNFRLNTSNRTVQLLAGGFLPMYCFSSEDEFRKDWCKANCKKKKQQAEWYILEDTGWMLLSNLKTVLGVNYFEDRWVASIDGKEVNVEKLISMLDERDENVGKELVDAGIMSAMSKASSQDQQLLLTFMKVNQSLSGLHGYMSKLSDFEKASIVNRMTDSFTESMEQMVGTN